ncbi:MAG: hypothetical protein IPN95_26990 [Bacteroidetes bacterium]|nr:hypothetical protein [Bacteroidota bacterium]MBL0019884.1 hypothetical protein [Bacteroidota bacterium]MBP6641397.1 hypothetical protein [Bacteroidia bacterium]
MTEKFLIVLLMVAVLAGCGKLTTVNSPREKEDISLVENAHYDAESKIRYMVSNDNTHVYVRFDTDNYSTIMRIRKLGAIIRFDTNGKKKGTHSLKYPVYNVDAFPSGPMSDPNVVPGAILRDDLFPPTTTAIWTEGEIATNIDLGINTEGFVCSVALDDKDVLMYRVGIPFKLIGGTRPEDFTSLNMEVEIPTPDTGPKTSTSSDPSSAMPGSMNNGMPGNMNNSPGSMSGPLPSGGMMSSGGVSGGIPAIRIWMQVNLSPSTAN